MIDTLAAHRESLRRALDEIVENGRENLAPVSPWGGDLLARLLDFAKAGKLIRGSLLVETGRLFSGTSDRGIHRLGAALELVQSFLLIHDDIMDEDPFRRGKPAVYEQYRLHGLQHGYTSANRFGESMAICGGDVAMLLAMEAVTTIDLEAGKLLEITRLLASEVSKVGVAQMGDVANGHRQEPADATEIEAVYRFKTGRYTFSLPMMLGAIYAGADPAIVAALSEWGEIQGIVFQIRDDHLGVMGDTDEIGKPAGSDILADKQTLHRLELFARIRGTDLEPITDHFGAESITKDDLARVRMALKETGTLEVLEDRVQSLRSQASRVLERVDLTDAQRASLAAIDEYNATRSV